MDNEAFVRAAMIVTGGIVALAVLFLFLIALLPRHVQAQVRQPIVRGTEQLTKILDGTASALAVVLVFSVLGLLIASVLLVAATMGH
ncbi:MAG: hypothetical protein AABM40_10555 [Chloroflexota bacterium]